MSNASGPISSGIDFNSVDIDIGHLFTAPASMQLTNHADFSTGEPPAQPPAFEYLDPDLFEGSLKAHGITPPEGHDYSYFRPEPPEDTSEGDFSNAAANAAASFAAFDYGF